MSVSVSCPRCASEFQVSYLELGSVETCSSCLHDVVPEVVLGSSIDPTGRELSFRDFLQLLRSPASRESVAPLLRSWFGYSISGESSRPIVFNERSEAIDLLWLHLKVQSNQAHQAELYNTAMNLWR